MKAFSVIEYSTKGVLKDDFMRAGAMRNITPEVIYQSSIKPWCVIDKGVNIGMKAVNDANFSFAGVVNGSIPRIVQKYPTRFPFFMPTFISSSNGIILRTTASLFRDKECELRH